MPSSDAVIVTRELRKQYPGAKIAAVESLDLTVGARIRLRFLGPNGAGKTTTIGMLLGNVFPTRGEGTVLDRPIGDRETRRHIGYLPEKFQFHEFLTVTEFLDLHGKLVGMDAAARRRRIPAVLDLVGLSDRASSKLREFSKGMQQRAGLAQAILHEPALVILDEPTSALDPLGRRAVRDIVLYLKQHGTTVLLNSHLLSEIERTCDTIAIIKRGRIIRQGTVDEITAASSSVIVDLDTVTPAIISAATRFGTVVHTPSSTNLSVTLTDDPNSVVPDLIHALVTAGARIRAVTPVRESLEDAFVRVMEEER